MTTTIAFPRMVDGLTVIARDLHPLERALGGDASWEITDARGRVHWVARRHVTGALLCSCDVTNCAHVRGLAKLLGVNPGLA